VIWGGLSPGLLEKISTYPDLCREAQRVLNSMYCATLPREVHVKDLINKEIGRYYNSCQNFGQRKKRTGRAMMVLPDPEQDSDNYDQFTNDCICHSGIHTHCMTCRKPPRGWTGCRLAKPSGLVEKTGPVELVDITQPDNHTQIEFEINDTIRPLEEVTDGPVDPDVAIVNPPDPRLVVWEIERPSLPPLPEPPNAVEFTGGLQQQKEWYIKQLQDAMHAEAHTGTTQQDNTHPTAEHVTQSMEHRMALSTRYDTAQHETAQHDTTQHDTAQHNTTQHSTTQHSTAQHDTAQHDTARHSTA